MMRQLDPKRLGRRYNSGAGDDSPAPPPREKCLGIIVGVLLLDKVLLKNAL
jgi:hypothetical protein